MSDEFICDTREVRAFIGKVQAIVASTPSIAERLAAIRSLFSQVMADPNWLPHEFRRTYEHGGMGKGIANWLLYRDTEGTLSLSALVLPHGSATPVHDHLAWGLVGLYVGEQDEEIYEPAAPVHAADQHSNLKLAENKHLRAGSFEPETGAVAPFRSGYTNIDCEK
jgi:predicted metal-dependent enzyme (double-stranded beta helix superfamily)